MGQTSTKDLLRETADKLPPGASVEDAMERLLFLAKIERGLDEAKRAFHNLVINPKQIRAQPR